MLQLFEETVLDYFIGALFKCVGVRTEMPKLKTVKIIL